MRTHLRARRLLGVALLLAAGLVGTPAEASPPAGGMTATAVTSVVGAYGDNSGRWAGGDTTVSLRKSVVTTRADQSYFSRWSAVEIVAVH